MSEQRDETRPPGCPLEFVRCKFRIDGVDLIGQVHCESCSRERIPLSDALNAMFARLEAAEKR